MYKNVFLAIGTRMPVVGIIILNNKYNCAHHSIITVHALNKQCNFLT